MPRGTSPALSCHITGHHQRPITPPTNDHTTNNQQLHQPPGVRKPWAWRYARYILFLFLFYLFIIYRYHKMKRGLLVSSSCHSQRTHHYLPQATNVENEQTRSILTLVIYHHWPEQPPTLKTSAFARFRCWCTSPPTTTQHQYQPRGGYIFVPAFLLLTRQSNMGRLKPPLHPLWRVRRNEEVHTSLLCHSFHFRHSEEVDSSSLCYLSFFDTARRYLPPRCVVYLFFDATRRYPPSHCVICFFFDAARGYPPPR